MFIKKINLEEKDRLEKEIAKIEKGLSNAPRGSLLAFQKKGKYQYYQRLYEHGKEHRIYLGKDQKNLITKLAWKGYYLRRLEDAKEEFEAIKSFLSVFDKYPNKGRFLTKSRVDEYLKNPEYRRLLGKEDLQAWAEEDYEKLEAFSEHLIHKGSDGQVTRSKSEEIIREVLMKYQIPFRYDCKIMLGDEVVYADFVIRHPKTGKVYVWEHFGMMDDASYRSKNIARLNKYLWAGYTPMLDLIITSETRKEPMSFFTAEAVVRHFFLS